MPTQGRADVAYGTPDFETIANFRRDYGAAIRNARRHFVELCRGLRLLSSVQASFYVPVDAPSAAKCNTHSRCPSTSIRAAASSS